MGSGKYASMQGGKAPAPVVAPVTKGSGSVVGGKVVDGYAGAGKGGSGKGAK